MHTARLLATSATAVVLALGLSACGSDDDAAPASSTSSVDSQAPSSSSPSADASQAQPGAGGDDDGDVTDAELRSQLEQVALDEVGEGRVSDVEYADDRDHAYEVDVELGNDDDVTVEIAEDLSVVRVDR
jgi:uncharacterized membrane protein YkoI